MKLRDKIKQRMAELAEDETPPARNCLACSCFCWTRFMQRTLGKRRLVPRL